MGTRARSTKNGLLAFLGTSLVLALFVLRRSEREVSPPATSAADRAAAQPLASEALATPAEMQVLTDVRLEPPLEALGEDQRIAVAGQALAELHGKLVLEDGRPAAGASLALNGWEGNQERVLRHGMPESWSDVRGVSAPDGRFSLRFDPPLAFQFTLDAELEGFATASWRWGEIPPGARMDLGTIPLLRGGEITGRVVNERGEPAVGAWTVYADGLPPAGAPGRDTTSVRVSADPATGVYRVRDMSPGPTELKAYSKQANWIDGPLVHVRAGETVEADIVYRGPDNSRRITVTVFSNPFYVIRPEPSAIRLLGLPTGPVQAQKITGSSQSHSFDDLPNGLYSVKIEDPRFLPWSKSDVVPGSTVSAHLKGNAALKLDVVDAATGDPIEPYSAILRFENVRFGSREFALRERGSDPPPNGTFDGLIPADYTVIVEAAGRAPVEMTLDGLAPYETRSLLAVLGRGGAVVGTVLRANGEAVAAGIRVGLVPDLPELVVPEDPRERHGFFERWIERQQLLEKIERVTESDARGRFRFDGLPAGVYRAKASPSALLNAEIGGIQVTEGGEVEVQLALPASGTLVGHVLAPEDASFAGLSVSLRRQENEQDSRLPWQMPPKTLDIVLASDGSFRAGYLPVGDVTLFLSLPAARVSNFGSAAHIEGAAREIGRATIAAGEETRLELDARGLFPGALDLEVSIEDRPATGMRVSVLAMGERLGEQAHGTVDSAGEVHIGPLLPGDWVLIVPELEGKWIYLLPETLTIPAGETLQRRIAFELHEAELRLLDPEGNPLAGKSIRVLPDSPLIESLLARTGSTGTTDEEGLLRLKMPSGDYLLFRSTGGHWLPMGQRSGTPLSWPSAGPFPREVTLR